jgi:phosphatidylglycerol:prolipoprotein diacylglycerol transferase
LFKVAGYPILTWGVSLALAFIVCTLVAAIIGKKRGLKSDTVIDAALIICIVSILTARLLYVILNFDQYSSDPISIIYLRDGGLSFIGGAIGGILTGWLFTRVRKVSFADGSDVGAVVLTLGYGIVRLGCLANGCCYGLPSDVSWALACGPGEVLRHPTQLYASILGFLMFAVLLFLFLKKSEKFKGLLIWLYVAIYSAGRFAIEFFRVGPRDYFSPLTLTQVFTIVTFLAAVGVIVIELGKRKARG